MLLSRKRLYRIKKTKEQSRKRRKHRNKKKYRRRKKGKSRSKRKPLNLRRKTMKSYRGGFKLEQPSIIMGVQQDTSPNVKLVLITLKPNIKDIIESENINIQLTPYTYESASNFGRKFTERFVMNMTGQNLDKMSDSYSGSFNDLIDTIIVSEIRAQLSKFKTTLLGDSEGKYFLYRYLKSIPPLPGNVNLYSVINTINKILLKRQTKSTGQQNRYNSINQFIEEILNIIDNDLTKISPDSTELSKYQESPTPIRDNERKGDDVPTISVPGNVSALSTRSIVGALAKLGQLCNGETKCETGLYCNIPEGKEEGTCAQKVEGDAEEVVEEKVTEKSDYEQLKQAIKKLYQFLLANRAIETDDGQPNLIKVKVSAIPFLNNDVLQSGGSNLYEPWDLQIRIIRINLIFELFIRHLWVKYDIRQQKELFTFQSEESEEYDIGKSLSEQEKLKYLSDWWRLVTNSSVQISPAPRMRIFKENERSGDMGKNIYNFITKEIENLNKEKFTNDGNWKPVEFQQGGVEFHWDQNNESNSMLKYNASSIKLTGESNPAITTSIKLNKMQEILGQNTKNIWYYKLPIGPQQDELVEFERPTSITILPSDSTTVAESSGPDDVVPFIQPTDLPDQNDCPTGKHQECDGEQVCIAQKCVDAPEWFERPDPARGEPLLEEEEDYSGDTFDTECDTTEDCDPGQQCANGNCITIQGESGLTTGEVDEGKIPTISASIDNIQDCGKKSECNPNETNKFCLPSKTEDEPGQCVPKQDYIDAMRARKVGTEEGEEVGGEDIQMLFNNGCPDGTTIHPNPETKRGDGGPVCLTPEQLNKYNERNAAQAPTNTAEDETNITGLFGDDDDEEAGETDEDYGDGDFEEDGDGNGDGEQKNVIPEPIPTGPIIPIAPLENPTQGWIIGGTRPTIIIYRTRDNNYKMLTKINSTDVIGIIDYNNIQNNPNAPALFNLGDDYGLIASSNADAPDRNPNWSSPRDDADLLYTGPLTFDLNGVNLNVLIFIPRDSNYQQTPDSLNTFKDKVMALVDSTATISLIRNAPNVPTTPLVTSQGDGGDQPGQKQSGQSGQSDQSSRRTLGQNEGDPSNTDPANLPDFPEVPTRDSTGDSTGGDQGQGGQSDQSSQRDQGQNNQGDQPGQSLRGRTVGQNEGGQQPGQSLGGQPGGQPGGQNNQGLGGQNNQGLGGQPGQPGQPGGTPTNPVVGSANSPDPLRYSQPTISMEFRVRPGLYQPGLYVHGNTGQNIEEWLRHLGDPNPIPFIDTATAQGGQEVQGDDSEQKVQGGGRKKRKKRKTMKKRRKRKNKTNKRKKRKKSKRKH